MYRVGISDLAAGLSTAGRKLTRVLTSSAAKSSVKAKFLMAALLAVRSGAVLEVQCEPSFAAPSFYTLSLDNQTVALE